MINIFYAIERQTLEKYWNFRDAEKRVINELSSERISEIRAAVSEKASEKPLYKVENGVANIDIVGSLTPQPTMSANLFGEAETVYTDIAEATLQADEDDSVNSIAYHVNSPGGNWDGLDLAAQFIADAEKPTVAYVYSMAASAAYYLASQADRVVAMTRGTQVGSIGVATEIFDHTIENEKKGVKRIVMTNDASEDKRPDASTDEGYQAIKDELNDIYGIFEERVIEGRTAAGVEAFSAKNITALKGRVVTAKKALALGLIDEIQPGRKKNKRDLSVDTEKKTADKNTDKTIVDSKDINNMEGNMDLIQFLESNPEARAEHDTLISQAKRDGAKAEAERRDKIHALSATVISPEAKEAIEKELSPEAYAMEAMKIIAANKAKSNASQISVPKAKEAQDEVESTLEDPNNKAISFWDKAYKGDK